MNSRQENVRVMRGTIYMSSLPYKCIDMIIFKCLFRFQYGDLTSPYDRGGGVIKIHYNTIKLCINFNVVTCE